MGLLVTQQYSVSTPNEDGRTDPLCPPIEGRLEVRDPQASTEIRADVDRYDDCGNKAKGTIGINVEINPDYIVIESKSSLTLEGGEMKAGTFICAVCD